MRRLVALAIATPALAVSLAGMAAAPAVQAATCTPGLATAITWDHSDPQYMQVVPAVTWQNCNKVIRKVTLETRAIDNRGGLADSTTATFTADVAHKPSGRQTYSNPRRFSGSTFDGYEFGGFFDPDQTGTAIMKSCVQLSNGTTVSSLNGVTFYNVATAYNARGKKILQKISPPVACDQNG